MRYDPLFRAINTVGFIANTASLCMPYELPQRHICKTISRFCDVCSVGISFFADQRTTMFLANLMSVFADTVSLGNMSAASSNPAMVLADDSLRYGRDGAVAVLQFTNIVHGIRPHRNRNKGPFL